MKQEVTSDPNYIGRFGADRVMFAADNGANLIEEANRYGRFSCG